MALSYMDADPSTHDSEALLDKCGVENGTVIERRSQNRGIRPSVTWHRGTRTAVEGRRCRKGLGAGQAAERLVGIAGAPSRIALPGRGPAVRAQDPCRPL